MGYQYIHTDLMIGKYSVNRQHKIPHIPIYFGLLNNMSHDKTNFLSALKFIKIRALIFCKL